jgi:hypothetical protein
MLSKEKPHAKETSPQPLQQPSVVRNVLRVLQLLELSVCHVHFRFVLMLVAHSYARTFWRKRLGDAAALIRRLLLERLFWAVTSNFRRLCSATLTSCRVWLPPPYCHHAFMNDRIPVRGAVAMEESAASRPRRPESITIDHLLMSGPNSPMRPPPAGRLPASPTTRTSYESFQTASQQLPTRPRTDSVADTTQQAKRLSLSFPVNGPTARPSRPPSWANSPVTPPESIASPTEPSNFLTVLATQERRVLELKEELRQAEQELEKLKRQWASQESTRKRNDVRRVQQLQPLSANLPTLDTTEEDVDGSSQWMQKEMERRKSILSGVKTSNRKVFSGSRHTRTLSLLSPEKTTFSQPFPMPRTLDEAPGRPRPPPLTRSSTTSDIATNVANPSDESISQIDGADHPKDALLRTGKQMAADIREGLMTFIEDIRQATVGEEAVADPLQKSTQSRNGVGRSSSRASTIGSKRGGRPGHSRSQTATAIPSGRDSRHDTLIDVGGSFWREHGIESPNSKTSKSSKRASKRIDSTPKSSIDEEEAWDMWGTPVKHIASPPLSNSGSSLNSENPNTPSDTQDTPLSSARDGFSSVPPIDRTLAPTGFGTRASTAQKEGKRDSIPWPALVKLSPGNLKRTASHLMSEWEKSLTSTPSGEHDSDSGLDYPLTPPVPSQAKFKKAD